MSRIRAGVRVLQDHPLASDGALASVLAVIVLLEIWTSGHYLTGSKWIYAPAALLMTVALAWRRRDPLLVTFLVMGALVGQSIALGDSTPSPDLELVTWLVAAYSVALHGERWKPYVGGIVSIAAGLVWLGLDDFLLPVVTFGGAWLAGRFVNKRQLYASALEERASVLE